VKISIICILRPVFISLAESKSVNCNMYGEVRHSRA